VGHEKERARGGCAVQKDFKKKERAVDARCRKTFSWGLWAMKKKERAVDARCRKTFSRSVGNEIRPGRQKITTFPSNASSTSAVLVGR
jgi:hypothetical protein